MVPVHPSEGLGAEGVPGGHPSEGLGVEEAGQVVLPDLVGAELVHPWEAHSWAGFPSEAGPWEACPSEGREEQEGAGELRNLDMKERGSSPWKFQPFKIEYCSLYTHTHTQCFPLCSFLPVHVGRSDLLYL